MTSNKGVPYSRIILITGIALFVFIVICAVLNFTSTVKNAPEWQFFLLFGGTVLFFGIVGSIVFPNTRTVKIIDNGIEVCTKSVSELIPISNIKRITASTSFMNQSWNTIDFYKVELKENTQFGQVIYFNVNSKRNNEFVQTLKNNLAKGVGQSHI